MAEKWASKEQLFKLSVPRERHEFEGIGSIWIHGLTCGQKDDYEDRAIRIEAGSRQIHMSNARALLLVMCCYDQHGRRLFADKDIGRICQLPASIVEPVFEKARRLSGMGRGELEELAKNSEKILGEDFDSD